PLSPFRFLNANANVGASAVPLLDTSTEGVPVLLSTDAVTLIFGVAPVSPFGPCGPVAPGEPSSPAGPCAPVSPLEPCAPVSPFGPCGPRGPVTPFNPENDNLRVPSSTLPVPDGVPVVFLTSTSTLVMPDPPPA